jgi:putative ABC transport system permease protein
MNRWLRLLEWCCPPSLYESIEGDLLEQFEEDKKQLGEKKAKTQLAFNVIKFLRPGILLRNQFKLYNPMMLASDYLKFTWRSLGRHKVFSFINITGLTIGMALCLMITNYVLFEKSYDQFYPRHKDIVRVTYSRFFEGEFQYSKAQVFPAVAEVAKNAIPEVEEVVRIFPVTTHVEAVFEVTEQNQLRRFTESDLYAVDSSFFKVFPLQFIEGDPNTALTGKNKIVLSAAVAEKYFGKESALNKVIKWDGMGDWQITGVFKDLPENSHMKLGVLTSWMEVYEPGHDWNWDGFYTYLLLQPDADISKLTEQIQRIADSKMKGDSNPNQIASEFDLQPIGGIHLHSHLVGEMRMNGNAVTVNALQIVAILIVSLALMNYLNLSLTRAFKRGKEVGVRKVIGSTRSQLVQLFIMESSLFNFISFFLAIGISLLGASAFNSLVERPVDMIIWRQSILTYGLIVVILLVSSFLSGFYPALILASFNPVAALKGGHRSPYGRSFRRLLIIAQFFITITLVTGTILIYKQTMFMQQQDLGFSLSQKLIIKSQALAGSEMDSAFVNRIALFKMKIKEDKDVLSATITSTIPGRENEWLGRITKPDKDELISSVRMRVDIDFLDTYGLRLVAGKNFSDEQQSQQIIINESTAKTLGYENNNQALGKKLMRDHEIVGVVNDFHEQSMRHPIVPSLYSQGQGYMKYITVNVSSENIFGTVTNMKKYWLDVFPDRSFEYFFLDEYFNRQYQQEKQLGKVFGYFSGIGIFIACLGLLGFAYFMSHQRLKEIGIRKALGATAASLIQLLSSELTWLLLLGGTIAIPFSYYFSMEWLSTYRVRIETGWELFVLPIIFVGMVAFASVFFILVKAIQTNPIDILKNE